jgi:N-formylglutamate deformylase
VDVERLPDDTNEPMAAKGMGAVYTRLSTGQQLRRSDPSERARLMAEWYNPHHARLTDAVDAALSEEEHCLIIDIHSFSSRPLPHEHDQDLDRPEICIGTDPFHSPLEDMTALTICERFGFRAAMNRPFSGSMVPTKHWGGTTAVHSMMVEVRRDLYMSEATGTPLPEFSTVATKICRMIEALVASSVERFAC